MTSEVMQRRLAAIVSADVAGYSRLMADDEDATVRTLTAYREATRTSASGRARPRPTGGWPTS
jgi:class 3 adenylate cyclase